MNNDEAKKCILLSKDYLKKGDREKAVKFAKKAVSLLDSSENNDWLKTVQNSPATSPNTTKEEKKPTEKIKEEDTARPYTKVQVETITRIIAKKKKGDLYGILNIEKESTEIEIKRAYRKLALLCHPG